MISVKPSLANSRSSKERRVGSASALNTRSSSSVTSPPYVTKWSHISWKPGKREKIALEQCRSGACSFDLQVERDA